MNGRVAIIRIGDVDVVVNHFKIVEPNELDVERAVHGGVYRAGALDRNLLKDGPVDCVLAKDHVRPPNVFVEELNLPSGQG